MAAINAIARKAGVDSPALGQMVRAVGAREYADLTRRQSSALIDRLPEVAAR